MEELSLEQGCHLAPLRELLGARGWAGVKQAFDLLIAFEDPALWAVMGRGLAICDDRVDPCVEWSVTDLRALSGLSRLRVLSLSGGHRLRNLGGLSPLSGLRRLLLWGFPAADAGALATLSGLRTLQLWQGEALADVSALGVLDKLQHLRLEECPALPPRQVAALSAPPRL